MAQNIRTRDIERLFIKLLEWFFVIMMQGKSLGQNFLDNNFYSIIHKQIQACVEQLKKTMQSQG